MTENEVMDQVKKEEVEQGKAEGIMIDSRTQVVFKGQKCTLTHPTVQQDSDIERYCASKFLDLLKAKVPTQRTLKKELEKSGDWTKKDDKELQEAQLRYRDYYKEFLSVPVAERIDNPKYDELDGKVRVAMEKLMELNIQQNMFFAHSIERKLDTEATLMRMSQCIRKEDGTPLFGSMEAVQAEQNDQDFSTLLTQAMMFWRGVDERFLEKPPASLNGDAAMQPPSQDSQKDSLAGQAPSGI